MMQETIPNGWRYQKLERLLKRWGFVISRGKGSHFTAVHVETGVRTGLVRHSSELSRDYVKDAVAAIDEVIAMRGETYE